MRIRPIVWMAFGLAALGAAAFLYSRGMAFKPVPLSPNSELRILALCVGERRHLSENAWRRLVRRFREKLDPPAPGSSRLFLSLGEFDRSKQNFVAATFANPIVRLPDGRAAYGALRKFSNNIVQLEFQVFPRADRKLAFELLRGGEKIQFNIRNPGPVQPTDWKALPLPRTNGSFQTRLILEKSGPDKSPALRLNVQALGRATVKWMHWRAQVFDELGNWEELRVVGTRVRPPAAPTMGDCVKLIVRGAEYISAGMIALPQPGEFQELRAPLRAIELGLKQVFLLGPGEYRLLSGKTAETVTTNASGVDRVEFLAIDSMSIQCTKPSLLLLLTNSPGSEHLSARFRERGAEERKDRKFLPRSFTATDEFDTRMIARLLSFNLNSSHARLEAEIIFYHPPAEFFVPREAFGK